MLVRHLTLALAAMLFLSTFCVYNVFAADQGALSDDMQQLLADKYPNHKVAKSCSGTFVGKPNDAIAVINNGAKKEFIVLWVMSNGNVQQLDSVIQAEPEFEMQCMNAKEAKEREHDVHTTDTIVGTLRALKGLGAVCYFSDDTTAKCWSLDRATGRLIEIGGWLT